MPKLRAIVLLLACLRGFPSAMSAAETNLWVIEAEKGDSLTFNVSTGTITYTNGVVVHYGDAILSARRAQLDQESGEVLAEGSVRLQEGNKV